MNAFSSLTAQCAQCHDHKRDPVTMTDYYRLQAVFAALDRAERPFDDNPELASERAALQAEVAALEAAAADPVTTDDRGSVGHRLESARARLEALPPPQLVYAGTVHYGEGNFLGRGHVGGQPRPVHLLDRGDVRSPGEEVEPGALASSPRSRRASSCRPDHAEGDRRVALAAGSPTRTTRSPGARSSTACGIYHFGSGHRRYAERLRAHGAAADAPGVARLARRRIPRRGPIDQGPAPPDL